MRNYRYTQIILPIDRYVSRLTPKAKMLLRMLQGSLVLVLLTSIVFYIQ